MESLIGVLENPVYLGLVGLACLAIYILIVRARYKEKYAEISEDDRRSRRLHREKRREVISVLIFILVVIIGSILFEDKRLKIDEMTLIEEDSYYELEKMLEQKGFKRSEKTIDRIKYIYFNGDGCTAMINTNLSGGFYYFLDKKKYYDEILKKLKKEAVYYPKPQKLEEYDVYLYNGCYFWLTIIERKENRKGLEYRIIVIAKEVMDS